MDISRVKNEPIDTQLALAGCQAGDSPLPESSRSLTHVFIIRGPFYQHGLTLIPAWISNHMPSKVWDEITCPFPNFSGTAVEVWEWRSNFIPHLVMDVITYSCCDLSWTMLMKGAPDLNVLTHWGRDKMDAISQTTFSSAFSWMKIFEFRLKFPWSLFLRVQSTIFQHWFR